jgi:hypothetical protein
VQGKHQETGEGTIREWVRRHNIYVCICKYIHTYIYIYIYIYIQGVRFSCFLEKALGFHVLGERVLGFNGFGTGFRV